MAVGPWGKNAEFACGIGLRRVAIHAGLAAVFLRKQRLNEGGEEIKVEGDVGSGDLLTAQRENGWSCLARRDG